MRQIKLTIHLINSLISVIVFKNKLILLNVVQIDLK
jgi:hypothetical protein